MTMFYLVTQLNFFYRDQVFNFFDHTEDLRSGSDFTRVVDSAQTESLHGAFLAGRATNDASDLFYSQCFCFHV